MAINEGSFSFLTQSQSTRTPANGFLKLGEPYLNAGDGTLWIGSTSDIPLEIGLNCKTGLISDTGKFLTRDADNVEINIPYDPTQLRTNEYFEFFILFSTVIDNPGPTYSQPIDWGNIPDPFPTMSTGQQLYVKFFSYGLSTSWSAVPVWSDDPALSFFSGGADNKFFYIEVQDPSGFTVNQQPTIQFQGPSVTVMDDAFNNRTVVEISASGSGGGGSDITNVDFLAQGTDLTIANAGGNRRIFVEPTTDINLILETAGANNTTWYQLVNIDPGAGSIDVKIDSAANPTILTLDATVTNVAAAYTGTDYRFYG